MSDNIANELKKFNDLVVDTLMDNQRELSLDLYGRFTSRTPVDTGRARAAWNLSIGRKNANIPRKKKSKNAKYAAPKHNNLILKPYDTIYITNNMPYILKLESGDFSKKSSGMVARSVNEVYNEMRLGVY